MVAAYDVALARRGVPVKVLRISGFAPNTTTVEANVRGAIVAHGAAGAEAYGGAGQITRSTHQIVLLAADLAAQDFPLPLAKDDKLVLANSSERLNVESADPETRALAGAIVVSASGVA